MEPAMSWDLDLEDLQALELLEALETPLSLPFEGSLKCLKRLEEGLEGLEGRLQGLQGDLNRELEAKRGT